MEVALETSRVRKAREGEASHACGEESDGLRLSGAFWVYLKGLKLDDRAP